MLKTAGFSEKKAYKLIGKWNSKLTRKREQHKLKQEFGGIWKGIKEKKFYFPCKWLQENGFCPWTKEDQKLLCPLKVLVKDKYWEKSKLIELFEKLEEEITAEDVSKVIEKYTDKLNLAEQMWPIEPYCYDEAHIWWLWDRTKLCWKMVDETTILNKIDDALEYRSGSTRADFKNELLEALRRYGRRKLPQDIKKTWVQFGKKIIDIKTGETFEPTPDYFVTNPIPWEPSECEDTPEMDKIFTEWVGENYKQTLYEILAYCCLPDYPIHRIFCFNGGGCNGKGKFEALITKFIGIDNVCSSSLERIAESRFEAVRLHRKLVCFVGETNFSVLSKSDMIKRATGQDHIPGEHKGKSAFDFVNYAKWIIATNTLPATTDKTVGFYRRWFIIDWPNQFKEGSEVLDRIPEHEFNNLACKVMRILKELLMRGGFTNEGDIEHRKERYEDISNPVALFIREQCTEGPEDKIPYNEFRNLLRVFMRNKKGRKLSTRDIRRLLDLEGFSTDRVHETIGYDDDVKRTTKIYVLGLKWNENGEK
jgi:P4 family phage/plasmid primase-like protien